MANFFVVQIENLPNFWSEVNGLGAPPVGIPGSLPAANGNMNVDHIIPLDITHDYQDVVFDKPTGSPSSSPPSSFQLPMAAARSSEAHRSSPKAASSSSLPLASSSSLRQQQRQHLTIVTMPTREQVWQSLGEPWHKLQRTIEHLESLTLHKPQNQSSSASSLRSSSPNSPAPLSSPSHDQPPPPNRSFQIRHQSNVNKTNNKNSATSIPTPLLVSVVRPKYNPYLRSHDSECSCTSGNCLHTKCDCFQSHGYCRPNCKCESCQNTSRYEPKRRNRYESSIIIYPNSFRPLPTPRQQQQIPTKRAIVTIDDSDHDNDNDNNNNSNNKNNNNNTTAPTVNPKNTSSTAASTTPTSNKRRARIIAPVRTSLNQVTGVSSVAMKSSPQLNLPQSSIHSAIAQHDYYHQQQHQTALSSILTSLASSSSSSSSLSSSLAPTSLHSIFPSSQSTPSYHGASLSYLYGRIPQAVTAPSSLSSSTSASSSSLYEPAYMTLSISSDNKSLYPNLPGAEVHGPSLFYPNGASRRTPLAPSLLASPTSSMLSGMTHNSTNTHMYTNSVQPQYHLNSSPPSSSSSSSTTYPGLTMGGHSQTMSTPMWWTCPNLECCFPNSPTVSTCARCNLVRPITYYQSPLAPTQFLHP
jgi:hypothetical protein